MDYMLKLLLMMQINYYISFKTENLHLHLREEVTEKVYQSCLIVIRYTYGFTTAHKMRNEKQECVLKTENMFTDKCNHV